jgi:MYXO-CTERM domain-containing protein
MKISVPFSLACVALILGWSESTLAAGSAELYTTQSYQYGRFEARIRFAPGSGVVSSFFLWKDGSEVAGTFWNELDFEKLDADCHLVTNAFFGNPGQVHTADVALEQDLCGEFHTYKYEWTPEYIAWFVDEVEVRRETGATATAYAENATAGMQFRFNVWPGNASFGGVFDPSIVPVFQYVDWVQYSAYSEGAFALEWREDFEASAIPAGWSMGNWGSPKNLSTHSPLNIGIVDGYAALALTSDDALGTEGASPEGPGPMLDTSTTGTSTTAESPNGPYGDDSGCSCRVTPQRGGTSFSMILLLGAAVVGGFRRLRRAGVEDT